MSDAKSFMIEDARLIFRNFSGKESQYNRDGDRNFSVILNEEDAEQMLLDGWNVKYLKARDEDDEVTPYITISVGYKVRPPQVVMLSSKARTSLSEESVEVLDWADIAKADLIARAYNWEVNGKSGIKAYLKSLFVTLEEDALELKYAVSNSDEE